MKKVILILAILQAVCMGFAQQKTVKCCLDNCLWSKCQCCRLDSAILSTGGLYRYDLNFAKNNISKYQNDFFKRNSKRTIAIPNPITSNYEKLSSLGGLNTLSAFHSFPLIGAYAYIKILYPIQLSDRLSFNMGAYTGKYLIHKRINNDFGLITNVNYLLYPNLYINIEYQGSLTNTQEIATPIRSMYPHSNTNFNVLITPKENIKLKLGITKD